MIYISSGAVQRPDVSGVAYQATKHGLVGLAHGTREEEREHGIRTTVIFPGLTETPLLQKRPTPTPRTSSPGRCNQKTWPGRASSSLPFRPGLGCRSCSCSPAPCKGTRGAPAGPAGLGARGVDATAFPWTRGMTPGTRSATGYDLTPLAPEERGGWPSV